MLKLAKHIKHVGKCVFGAVSRRCPQDLTDLERCSKDEEQTKRLLPRKTAAIKVECDTEIVS